VRVASFSIIGGEFGLICYDGREGGL